jgi:hypothetical protein
MIRLLLGQSVVCAGCHLSTTSLPLPSLGANWVLLNMHPHAACCAVIPPVQVVGRIVLEVELLLPLVRVALSCLTVDNLPVLQAQAIGEALTPACLASSCSGYSVFMCSNRRLLLLGSRRF